MSLKKSHPNRRHWRRHKSTFQTEMLEPRHLLAGMALISEFMASNDTTIQDEDLEFSDWLEITNVGDAALNLDGYAITDDPADRAQWRFPNINLDAGKTLLVFASGKDRTNPDSELHASFRLNAGGEYLALVAPDGATTLQEFAPEYPRQIADVSYGLGTTTVTTPLLSDNASANYFVPTDATLEDQWNHVDFNDDGWANGPMPLGYDTGISEPVGHWSFDNGNVDDDSGNELHGTNLLAQFPTSPLGRAISLPGTFDFGSVSASRPNFPRLQPTSQLALATWVKHTGQAGDIVAMGDHYRLRVNADDTVEFSFAKAVGRTSVTTNPAIASETVGDGQWHFIVGQKTATGVEIWIDGQLTSAVASDNEPIDYEDPANLLFIGGSPGAFNFGGQIDDVTIFDSSLDEATMMALFTGGGGDAPGPFTPEIATDVLADMNGVNSSAYIRIPFQVADPSRFNALRLPMKYDDGFVAYINGTEVLRVNAPGFEDDVVPFNAAATDTHTDATAIEYVTFNIDRLSDTLTVGDNILAIQALNASASNPDFLISARLDAAVVTLSTSTVGYITDPTPDDLNLTVSSGLGPIVSDVDGLATQPGVGDEVVVTAAVVETLEPVSRVQLVYRVLFADEIAIDMVDDGSGDDALAGDNIYTATIPADVAEPGEMLRWYLRAMDALGVNTREPSTDFVEGSDPPPEYFGTVIADPTVTSDIDVLHWFVENEAAAGTRSGTRASLFFHGEFYDNVFVRQRGGSTANASQARGKTNFKFDFKGNTFRYDPNYDRVEEFNLNSTASDKSYIRQPLAFEAYAVIGSPSSQSFPMHVQRNGEYYGVFAFFEEPADNMLEREGLDPDGALYKIYNEFTSANGSRKKTRKYEGNQDLVNFVSNVNSLNGEALSNYLFDNVDIPTTLNYLVATVITHQNDNPHKNHFVYRDSNNTGEWLYIPWDHDLTWGSNWVGTSYSDVIYADVDRVTFGPVPPHNLDLIQPSHPFVNTQYHREWNNHWNRLMDALLNDDRIREMYLRRLRTAMDEFLGSPDVDPETTYFNQRLNDYLATVQPDAAADKLLWNLNWGSSQTMAQAVEVIKNDYLAVRREHLYETHSIDNIEGNNGVRSAVAGIPHEQVAGIGLTFDDANFDIDPVSGNQDEEFLKLDNSNDTAVDITGWRLEGGISHTFKQGTVVEAGGSVYVSPNVPVFRARATGPSGGQGLFVQGNYGGHLSNLGETVQLVDDSGALIDTFTVAPNASENQEFLRISEINYNPDGNDATEFIELVNTSDSVTLDLSGVTLTDGPAEPFTISQGTSLAPGGRVVVVTDQAAFQAAYPEVSSAQIVGQFVGGLSNSGERITLDDVGNNTIMTVNYSDSDPWAAAADGRGATLVLNELAGDQLLGKHYSWRASTEIGGSPGTAAAEPIGVVINEVLANTDDPTSLRDAVELRNTTDAAIDISGWFLSDSSDPKYKIPAGTVLGAGDVIVYNESHFNPTPTAPGPNDFALGSTGESVWLLTGDFSGPTQLADFVLFTGTASGESIGRTDDSSRLVPLANLSLGCENSHPRVGPLVISEVNYHPGVPSAAAVAIHADLSRDDLEYVEIHNPTDSAVDLTDWRIRGGVEYDFDPGTSLAGGETVLVIRFNPDNPGNSHRLQAFREHYGLEANQRLLGGYTDQLANDGEVVRLERPAGENLVGQLVHSTEDEVLYDDLAPWATDADGGGASLHRTLPSAFGSTANSWQAVIPTPGNVDFSGVAGDVSGDGLVDSLDIDMLNTAINRGWSITTYDVDASGAVNGLDREYLVENVLGTFIGDANLDRSIDAADLNQVGSSWQQRGCLSWSRGDFNGDALVDALDLNEIGINWQLSAIPAAARVPRAPLASGSPAIMIDKAMAASLPDQPPADGVPQTTTVSAGELTTHVPRIKYRRSETRYRRLGLEDTDNDDRMSNFWGIDSTNWG